MSRKDTMDRNPQGQYNAQHYHGSNQHQGNNAPYSWAQTGMMPNFRGQNQGPVPPVSSPAQPGLPNAHNAYYNQAQSAHIATPTPSYASNQQTYSADTSSNYGQQLITVNPWGQYSHSQGQLYNTAPLSTTAQHTGQTYSQYMSYPPPTASLNNMPNQNQRQNSTPYSPAVHSYYQMQQQSANYYYPPQNQMYPTGVPPPPLPQTQPPQPTNDTSGATADKPRDSASASSRSGDKKSSKSSKSSSSFEDMPSSSKDKKPQTEKLEEKEEKDAKKPVPIMVGKRRGGRVLPTGVVKKQKVDDGNAKGKTDAWSQYMAEVRRYKDQSCTEERQNRPLVK